MQLAKDSLLLNSKYDDKMQGDLLKHYEIFVKSSENISLKRMSANKFYLALNTAIFGIASYASLLTNQINSIILSVIGIFLCSAWLSNISSYRKLNSAKFKVIHELEEHLPAKPFKMEDKYLGSNYALSKVERLIPLLFIALYSLIIIIMLPEVIMSFINNLKIGGLL